MQIVSLKEAKKKGLLTYFTGKPCKYGHMSERYVSIRTCVECKQVKEKEYREENREEYLKKKKEFYQRNKDKAKAYVKKNEKKIKARAKKYRELHKEEIKAYLKVYAEKNKEDKKEYDKEYRLKNAERYQVYEENRREQKKQYRMKNRDRYRAHCVRRRAEKLKLTPPLTQREIEHIESLYCAARKIYFLTGIPHHVDHIWPLGKQGVHHPCNLQVIPAQKNLKKNAAHDGVSGVSYSDFMAKYYAS
jgi:hypothetical protein